MVCATPTEDVGAETETVVRTDVPLVTTALPVLLSTVATMFAEPVETAVTKPALDTVTAVGFELLQVTARPVSTAPALSRAVAVACVVCPTGTVDDPSATLTLLTTEAADWPATLVVATPVVPSTAATIDAVPAATAVTTPVDETVATVVRLLDHTTGRPDKTFPAESFGIAVACVV